MPYVRFDKMSPAMKGDVYRMLKKRATWKNAGLAEMKLFEFWVTKAGKISQRGGHHQPTPEYMAALTRRAKGEDVRTRGDLRDFKTCTFHLSRD